MYVCVSVHGVMVSKQKLYINIYNTSIEKLHAFININCTSYYKPLLLNQDIFTAAKRNRRMQKDGGLKHPSVKQTSRD